MPAETLIQLGAELKKQRESKNILLQQIHNKTRIDVKFLEAIEEGNFDVLPEVYIRAFIKEYSASVDLNPMVVLEKYDALKRGSKFSDGFDSTEYEAAESESEQVAPSPPSAQTTTAASSQFQLSRNTIIYSSISIVAIALITYFVFFSGSEKKIITERPFEEVRQEQTKRFEIADSVFQKTEQKAQKDAVQGKKFNLNIVSSDTSWIRIEVDNSSTNEMVLYPGGNSMVDAESEVKVLVGNSGAIDFFLNNKKVAFAGVRKSVKYVKITPAGLEYLRINKASEDEQQN